MTAFLLSFFLIVTALCTSQGWSIEQTGNEPLLAEEQLLNDIPADANIPVVRKLKLHFKADLKAGIHNPKLNQVLVTLHHAALSEPPRSYDRATISLHTEKGFRVLKMEDSDPGSDSIDFVRITDTNPPLIQVRHVLSGTGLFVEDSVFSLSSDGRLFSIPIDAIKICQSFEPEAVRQYLRRFPLVELSGPHPRISYQVGFDSGPKGLRGSMEGDLKLVGQFQLKNDNWEPGFHWAAENCHFVKQI